MLLTNYLSISDIHYRIEEMFCFSSMSRLSDKESIESVWCFIRAFLFDDDADRSLLSLSPSFFLFTDSYIIMKNCVVVVDFEQIFVPYYIHLFSTRTLRMMTTTKILCYYLVRLLSLACLSLSLSPSDVRSLSEAFSSLYTLCMSTRRYIYNKQKFGSGEAYVHRISLFFFTTCSHS